ncbi:DUF6319 family protein [Mycolicibacter hiberniae]|uniref:Uncharacterized protein n=1 Tax=Mycolicibacter hiberniae TaxID=29314 RepID=A0A7I7X248_9MYCO|nr:DUF6319 family protein [Mycolicibacter hiberniae]MCV7084403.1 hypothetical protein [Mycolicibacter hiberniae]ORV67204.1 hypothetical protein AWC09_18635 [Mycolicibacter hiberniae]BBZ22937.1 hypothetical protein MHIB_13550 [Mycolicibacter hiberniae]
MTAPTFAPDAPAATADHLETIAFADATPAPVAEAPEAREDPEVKEPVKKSAGKKTKTLELTLTVSGTADGEWRAEIKQGSSYLVRNLAVAAAAVSRAAKELHEELFAPIEALMEQARSQHAARVAALEAELEAARKALADLD